MIRVGLVGLPNAGKSTLFNLLTGANVLVAPYPFSTVTPNKASLKVYDAQADKLADTVEAPDVLRTEVEVWDIAGLIDHASEGEGLGNEFLAQIKDCNVVVHVVRIDQGSTHDKVIAGIQTILNEMALFDHKCLLRPFEKARRMTHLYPYNNGYKKLSETLTKAYYGTKEGKPITDVLPDDELEAINDIGLISTKSRLLVLNVDESDNALSIAKKLHGEIIGNLLELAALVSMTNDERKFLGYSSETIYTFLQNYSKQLILRTHSKRFYTVGHMGVGQWIVPENADAKVCSQVVHNDLSDTIKAVKVAHLADFLKCKDWQSLTKQGLVRKYGPTYVPKDTEVIYFES